MSLWVRSDVGEGLELLQEIDSALEWMEKSNNQFSDLELAEANEFLDRFREQM